MTKADFYHVLDHVDELNVHQAGHDFRLKRVNRDTIRVSVDGDTREFRGCTTDEIKAEMERYKPGDWTARQEG